MRFDKRIIFKLGAIAGVGVTAYVAVKRASKIEEATKEVKEAMPEDKKEKTRHIVKAVPKMVKASWPVLVSGGATVGCVLVMDHISYKQIAALTASCAYLAKNRDYLAGKIKDMVGEEKLREIQEAFVKEEAPKEPWYGCSIEETGAGDLLCLEGYSGRWFRSSEKAVKEAQAMLQKLYEDDIYICMNDYYGYLNITSTQFGHELGWVNSKDWYPPELKFTNTLIPAGECLESGPDGKPLKEDLYVLEIDIPPMSCWQEV